MLSYPVSSLSICLYKYIYLGHSPTFSSVISSLMSFVLYLSFIDPSFLLQWASKPKCGHFKGCLPPCLQVHLFRCPTYSYLIKYLLFFLRVFVSYLLYYASHHQLSPLPPAQIPHHAVKRVQVYQNIPLSFEKQKKKLQIRARRLRYAVRSTIQYTTDWPLGESIHTRIPPYRYPIRVG